MSSSSLDTAMGGLGSSSDGGSIPFEIPSDLLSASQITKFLLATAGVLLLTWFISAVFACHGRINFSDAQWAKKQKRRQKQPDEESGLRADPTHRDDDRGHLASRVGNNDHDEEEDTDDVGAGVGGLQPHAEPAASGRRNMHRHRPVPHLDGFDKFNNLLARRLLYRAAKVSANSGVGVALTLLSALSTQENSTAAQKTTIFLTQLFLGFVITLLNLWSAMPANLQNELAVSRTKIRKLLRGGKICRATAEALCDEILDAINYHDRTNFVAYIESYREDRGSTIGSDEEGGD